MRWWTALHCKISLEKMVMLAAGRNAVAIFDTREIKEQKDTDKNFMLEVMHWQIDQADTAGPDRRLSVWESSLDRPPT